MAKTIKHSEDNTKAFWGEDDHLEVSQKKTFSAMIFELLTEKSPTQKQLEIFELILNLSIDHGPETPSAVATILAAKEGKSISESVATGLLQINERHGGAVEPAMKFFYQIAKEGTDVKELVSKYLEEKKLIGGFGHRIYTIDPRTELLFGKLQEAGFDDSYVEIAKSIQSTLSELKGKEFPINIDGAIAVILCTWDFDPKIANAVFICARMPGLCGQYLNTNH